MTPEEIEELLKASKAGAPPSLLRRNGSSEGEPAAVAEPPSKPEPRASTESKAAKLLERS